MLDMEPFFKGLAKNKWAVELLALLVVLCPEIFSNALANASGCLVVKAPVASAKYSRRLDIDICIMAAASGAKIIAAKPAIKIAGCVPSLRPPNIVKCKIRSAISDMTETNPKANIETRIS
jgi:hypothetical protein